MKLWGAILFGLLLPPRWLGKLLACQIYISLVAHLTVVPQSRSGQPSQTIFASLNFTFFPDSPKFKSYKKTFFFFPKFASNWACKTQVLFLSYPLWLNFVTKHAEEVSSFSPVFRCLYVFQLSQSSKFPKFHSRISSTFDCLILFAPFSRLVNIIHSISPKGNIMQMALEHHRSKWAPDIIQICHINITENKSEMRGCELYKDSLSLKHQSCAEAFLSVLQEWSASITCNCCCGWWQVRTPQDEAQGKCKAITSPLVNFNEKSQKL